MKRIPSINAIVVLMSGEITDNGEVSREEK